MVPGMPVRQIAAVFSIAVVLVLAVEGERGPAGLLLGGLSYSLYLNHWIPVFAVHVALSRAGLQPSDAAAVVAYLLAVGGAALHFLLIDRTIQRRRGAWFTVARGQALRNTGYALFLAGLALGLAVWGAPYWG